jgi:tetratricopeptide (TPR) repeat protein
MNIYRAARAKNFWITIAIACCFAVNLPRGVRGGEDPAGELSDEERVRIEADARAQADEADRLFKLHDYDAAIPIYQAERASRALLKDSRYEAYAVRAIGLCRGELEQYEAAIEAFGEAAAIDAKRGDIGMQGCDLFLLGKCRLFLGESKESAGTLEKAIGLLVEGKDRDHEAEARVVRGRALDRSGRLVEAVAELRRAATVAYEIGDEDRLAESWLEEADIALRLGESPLALELLTDSRILVSKSKKAAMTARCDRLLGDALTAIGRVDAARFPVERAAAEHRELEDFAGLAEDLRFLAILAIESGEFEKALRLATERIAAESRSGDVPLIVDAYLQKAEAERFSGDFTGESHSLEQAYKVASDAKSAPSFSIPLLVRRADCERDRKDFKLAGELLNQAERLAREARDDDLLSEIAEARADLRATIDAKTKEEKSAAIVPPK